MKNLAKMLIVVVLVTGAFVAVAQTAAPVATITAPVSGATYTTSQAVTFTAASAGSDTYSYNWNFGGTYPVAGQSVTNTFSTIGSKTITLTVRDSQGRSASASVTINITDGTTTALTITNVRVTDISSNSATIRWTTNRPADSRVIYDTVSHSSIAGASSPNYGYANSTGTSDSTTKVTEHAVTISGLTSNTHYYFRVISAE